MRVNEGKHWMRISCALISSGQCKWIILYYIFVLNKSGITSVLLLHFVYIAVYLYHVYTLWGSGVRSCNYKLLIRITARRHTAFPSTCCCHIYALSAFATYRKSKRTVCGVEPCTPVARDYNRPLMPSRNIEIMWMLPSANAAEHMATVKSEWQFIFISNRLRLRPMMNQMNVLTRCRRR